MNIKSRKMTFMLYLTAVFSMLFMLVSNPARADIATSVHDFSAKTYTGGNGSTFGTGQICVVCHTPHQADTTETSAPLWNHAPTAVTNYALYSSGTLNAGTMAQPTGSSMLCLSCHDGTISVDSFTGTQGGTSANEFVAGRPAVGAGTDGLSDDHPISFTYDNALATADGALHPPTSTNVTIGDAGVGGKTKSGTIAAVMLIDNQVQCASCHDVHNNFTADAKLLRVTMAGSQLCLTCHNK